MGEFTCADRLNLCFTLPSGQREIALLFNVEILECAMTIDDRITKESKLRAPPPQSSPPAEFFLNSAEGKFHFNAASVFPFEHPGAG